MNDLAHLVEMDPELVSRHVQLLVHATPQGQSLREDFEQALRQMGVQEARRMVLTITVMTELSFFHDEDVTRSIQPRARFEWDAFWLHSLYVARLTETVASAFEPVTDKEYLAGLLHDAGKLFMARYFPNEYEAAMLRAIERRLDMHTIEKQMFDCTHAEMSWALCERWKFHPDICRAVRFHHEPHSPFNKDLVDSPGQGFLAACVNVADSLARACGVTVVEAETTEGPDLNLLPSWAILQRLSPFRAVDVDSGAELEQTQEMIRALGLKATQHAEPQLV
jgi:putative nucleotidyltransferase with HDIG domain